MEILFLEESNHLSYETKPLVIGGWIIPKEKISKISEKIKEIKKKHGIKSNTELKWTKIGKAKIEAYKEIVEYALGNDDMKLRVLVANKQKAFKTNYKDWYIRLHYSLIYRSPISINGVIADRKGKGNEKSLNATLDFNKPFDAFPREFVSSHQSQIIQVSDIFLGAIACVNSDIESPYKKEIFNIISKKINIVNTTSLFSKQNKYNIFYWGTK